jgi:hypothetical protein
MVHPVSGKISRSNSNRNAESVTIAKALAYGVRRWRRSSIGLETSDMEYILYTLSNFQI